MIELVCVKTKDNGVTAEDVNRFNLSLARMKVTSVDLADFQACRLNVLTDDKTGLDKDIRVIPFLGNEDITNPSFLPIELHNYDDMLGHGTKTMYFDANFIARDLTLSFAFDGIPDRGTTQHTTAYISPEDKKRIEDENLATIELATEWWTGEEGSTYTSAYFGFVAGDTRSLYRKFMEDPAGYQEKYKTLADFYEGEWEGFILEQKTGRIGAYYVDNKEQNDIVNDLFEKNIRPTFETGGWKGEGGDMGQKFIEWNHEYQTITKQTSLLLLERGEDNKDPFTDRYLHLWVL